MWEDRYFQGFNHPGHCFQIFDWDLIDIFMYFSHDRLAIPPPGWIDISHKHGVKALGVFVVEGSSNEHGLKDTIELLTSDTIRQDLIQQMVEICLYFSFEGYLLNFEVDLKERDDVTTLMNNLQKFVRELKSHLHARVPQAEVIWYDALAMEGGSKIPEIPGGEVLNTARQATLLGELAWQDALNDGNRVFFDLCDGILTNYFWENRTLESDFQQSKPRNYDLYKGIDVFARGALAYEAGLGILKAVSEIQEACLSCGLFAPVYFFEKCPKNAMPAEHAAEFWTGMRQRWKQTHRLSELPFLSLFNCGHGNGMYIEGRRVSTDPWFHLSLQDILPTENNKYDGDIGFNGGGCLTLDRQSDGPYSFQLFRTHFLCVVYPKFYVSLIYASNHSIAVEFGLSDGNETVRSIALCVDMASQETFNKTASTDRVVTLVGDVEDIVQNDAMGDVPVPSVHWKKLSGSVDVSTFPGYSIDHIGILGIPNDDDVLAIKVGQVLVTPSKPDPPPQPPPCSVTNINITTGDGKSLGCDIEWASTAARIAVFARDLSHEGSIQNRLQFLGITTSPSGFFIRDYQIPDGVIQVEFCLRAQDHYGQWSMMDVGCSLSVSTVLSS